MEIAPSVCVLAFLLTMKSHPGEWIRTARITLGLSTRDLATIAGVSYPTVSRIERGHEYPRWDTLQRLLRATGRSLDASAPRPLPVTRLADLTDAWKADRSGHHEPDWTRLRAFADALARFPELTAAAIMPAPRRSGSLFIDSLLAGIAEKCADDADIQRPKWTKTRPGLKDAWHGLGTPRMQLNNTANTPPQLLARGMHVHSSNIWRTHQLHGRKQHAQRRPNSKPDRRTRRTP
jgi:transcriptional regulator with XRE-family HTH domain